MLPRRGVLLPLDVVALPRLEPSVSQHADHHPRLLGGHLDNVGCACVSEHVSGEALAGPASQVLLDAI
jgi:hypothetical protein